MQNVTTLQNHGTHPCKACSKSYHWNSCYQLSSCELKHSQTSQCLKRPVRLSDRIAPPAGKVFRQPPRWAGDRRIEEHAGARSSLVCTLPVN